MYRIDVYWKKFSTSLKLSTDSAGQSRATQRTTVMKGQNTVSLDQMIKDHDHCSAFDGHSHSAYSLSRGQLPVGTAKQTVSLWPNWTLLITQDGLNMQSDMCLSMFATYLAPKISFLARLTPAIIRILSRRVVPGGSLCKMSTNIRQENRCLPA